MEKVIDIKAVIYTSLKRAGIRIRPFCVAGNFYDTLLIPDYSTILPIELADGIGHNDGPVFQNNLAWQDGLKVFRIRTMNCMPLALDSFDYYLDDLEDSTLKSLINYLITEFNGTQTSPDPLDYSESLKIFLNDYAEYDSYYRALCCDYAELTHHTALRIKEQHKGEHIGTWIHSKGAGFVIDYKGMNIRSRKTSMSHSMEEAHNKGRNIANKDNSLRWMEYYALLKQFYEENGHSSIPRHYNTDLGDLGSWATRQRTSYKNGTLDKEYIRLLNDISFNWSPARTIQDRWDDMLILLQQYANEFGTTDVPQAFVYRGKALGKWVSKQRTLHRKRMLPVSREEKLNQIRFLWRSARSSAG